jgi:hypothetical protein
MDRRERISMRSPEQLEKSEGIAGANFVEDPTKLEARQMNCTSLKQ